MLDAVRALRVGDPSGDVDLGSPVSQAQLEKTEAALAGALDEGASLVTGGGRPDGDAFARGFWGLEADDDALLFTVQPEAGQQGMFVVSRSAFLEARELEDGRHLAAVFRGFVLIVGPARTVLKRESPRRPVRT